MLWGYSFYGSGYGFNHSDCMKAFSLRNSLITSKPKKSEGEICSWQVMNECSKKKYFSCYAFYTFSLTSCEGIGT